MSLSLEHVDAMIEANKQFVGPQTFPEPHEQIRPEDHPDIQAAWQRATGYKDPLEEIQQYWDKVNDGMSADKIWTDCPVCNHSGRHTLTGMGRKRYFYKCKNQRCESKFSYEPETGRYNKIREGEDPMSDNLHTVPDVGCAMDVAFKCNDCGVSIQPLFVGYDNDNDMTVTCPECRAAGWIGIRQGTKINRAFAEHARAVGGFWVARDSQADHARHQEAMLAQMQARLNKACEELTEPDVNKDELMAPSEEKQEVNLKANMDNAEEWSRPLPPHLYDWLPTPDAIPKGVEYEREGDMVRVGPATWDIGDNLRSVLIGGLWVVMIGAVLTMGLNFRREQSNAQQRRWEAEYYQNHGDARGYTEIPRGVIPVGKDR